jgi:hypothetical protein
LSAKLNEEKAVNNLGFSPACAEVRPVLQAGLYLIGQLFQWLPAAAVPRIL